MNNEAERHIFVQALERSEGRERQAYLESACAGDPSMLTRVHSLLIAHERAGRFLEGEAPTTTIPEPSVSQVDLALAEGPGAIVGRYKLLQEIGEGGFGMVYLAEQREPIKRRVALKIIKLGMDTRQVIARFEAERQALAMMDHPNIAKVLDGGATATGRPYFVMELVRGISLLKFCDENKLDTRQRLELFIRVCHAIHHAHQKGVIHRDIKPSNVLVTLHDDTPVPKVIDFGIAKATQQELTEKTIFTRYQEFIGTPAYMSPEQARFSGLDIDTRTDIYSLGVLLYELITGLTPFSAQHLLSAGHEGMRRIIVEEDPPRPSTRLRTLGQEDLDITARMRQADAIRLPKLVAGELDWIVMKALEKDRSRRYDSAASFAHDIECLLRNEPISAVPPSLIYRCRKFARRHRFSLAASAAVALSLILGTIISLAMAFRAHDAEQAAHESLAKELAANQAAQQAAAEARRAFARADVDAAIAADVNRFLNEEFLLVADPMNEVGRNITLPELVDRAAATLEGDFEGHPQVEASIRQTLGQVYKNQGNYPAAEKHARRLLQLREEQADCPPRDLIRARLLLASVRQLQGYYTETESAFETLYEQALNLLGEKDPLSLEVTYWLCLNRFANSKDDLAEPVTARMFALSDGVLPPDHWLRAAILSTRARYFLVANRFPEAEAFLDEWLEKNAQTIGKEHPFTLNLMSMLAYTREWTGKHEDAEALYARTISLKEKVLGPEHPSLLQSIEWFSLFLSRRDRFEEARTLLEKVYELRLKVLGLTHPATRVTVQNLHNIHGGAGRHDEAKALLRRALRADPLNFAALDGFGQYLAFDTLTPLLPDGEKQPVSWRYTTTDPGPAWLATSYDDRHWANGSSPFGNSEPVAIRTPWLSRSIWLRREFNLTELPRGHLVLRAMYDDAIEVYVNGQRVMRRHGWTGRRYRLAFCATSDGNPLRVGSNILAIRCQNVTQEGLIDAGLYVENPESSLFDG